ncbi:cuticle protein 7-like isoform X2 [Plodia interpunctella]|uniref:cuticle protein 7-like isoform X2 n=1 Tax=Plodia interpunctella TaxID=58824 RepID=UPI002367B660|nr:cuticle protein 7-like isoform X2 [Plodia interpunctella]
MYQLVCLVAVIAVAIAQSHYEQGHAYSSQSVVLHQSHGSQNAPAHLNAPKHQEHHDEVEYYAIPKYTYEYKVEDPHTHDSKYQRETRDHDVVKGEYSLHQPDGRIRIVKYTADKKNGFNAEVKYEGHAQHIVPELHQYH